MLPPDKMTRLVKLLGMLGSEFEGERANAAAMIDKIIREHGMTWQQMFEIQKQHTASNPPPAGAGEDESAMQWAERQKWSDDDVNKMHEYCCEHDSLYNNWELDFLESIGKWIADGRSITPKQLKVLLRLVEKGSQA